MNSSSSEPSSSSRWLQQQFLLLWLNMMETPTLSDGTPRNTHAAFRQETTYLAHTLALPVSVFWKAGTKKDSATMTEEPCYMLTATWRCH